MPEIAGCVYSWAGWHVLTTVSGTVAAQCYFRGVRATYFDANFVVMLGFKFVYAVFTVFIVGCFSLADDDAFDLLCRFRCCVV